MYAPYGLEVIAVTSSSSSDRPTSPRKLIKKTPAARAGRYDDVGQHVLSGRVNLTEAPFVEDLKQRYDTQPKACVCVLVEAWARLDQVHHACSLILEQMTPLLHALMNDIITETQKAVQAQTAALVQQPTVTAVGIFGPTGGSTASVSEVPAESPAASADRSVSIC